jgi:hypothetical protein
MDILSLLRVLLPVESMKLGIVTGGSQKAVGHGRRYVKIIRESDLISY